MKTSSTGDAAHKLNLYIDAQAVRERDRPPVGYLPRRLVEYQFRELVWIAFDQIAYELPSRSVAKGQPCFGIEDCCRVPAARGSRLEIVDTSSSEPTQPCDFR